MSGQNPKVVFDRVLSLKEYSPFILILDSIAQSSYFLLQELGYRSNAEIIFLAFESLNNPFPGAHFVDCIGSNKEESIKQFQFTLKKINTTKQKKLVIIDSLNYLGADELLDFISECICPNVTLAGVYHSDIIVREATESAYPNSYSLLNYAASSILQVNPFLLPSVDDEDIANQLKQLSIPIQAGLNNTRYILTMKHKRKSGRAFTHKLVVDAQTHSAETYTSDTTADDKNTDEIINDLTTFNLTTNNKQKLARELVELPFLEAQNELGSMGGAIVYEYEKDDDYDEDDPYEDPF